MKAIIADMINKSSRGKAFGAFNAIYGITWFLGSAISGLLYDLSIPLLVGFSMTALLLAIPFMIWFEHHNQGLIKT